TSPARRSHERATTKGHAWTRRQSSVLCERLPGRQASRTGPRSLHTGCATATDRMPSIARRRSLWYATRWDIAILRSLMNMQRRARIKALPNIYIGIVPYQIAWLVEAGLGFVQKSIRGV